ncbi:MAG TPA: cell division protein FtsA [Victivallales bacterium]|nr:cell division protein FtsA [Victivallales bacterium]
MSKYRNVITAIDIGTSKIKAVVGEASPDNDNINIIGYSQRNSENSVIKGEIADMDKASSILNEVTREAEKTSNTILDADNLYVSITGDHITSRNSSGTVIINTADYLINERQVDEALKNAKGLLLPSENEILNTVDNYFVLDDSHQVTDPIGHTASKLEAKTHIIFANRNRLENFQNLVKEQGFELSTPVFSGLASCLSVLTTDDLEHVTLTINMGAGITEYMIFDNYAVKETDILTVGCDHIANDLALGLDISTSRARDIINSNTLARRESEGHSTVEIKSSLKQREIPITTIEKVIELRIIETFEAIYSKIRNKGLIKLLNNGIILSGGIANFPNAEEIVRSIFDVPVRTGKPIDISGPDDILNDPGNITSLGLLRYGQHELTSNKTKTSQGFVKRIDNKLWSTMRRIWSSATNDKND